MSGVKKQQCVLRDENMLDSATGRVECHFECFTGTCVDNDIDIQVTALFELIMWRVGNQPNTQLCEVLFTLND